MNDVLSAYPYPRARSDDPLTSFQAAVKIERLARRQKECILAALKFDPRSTPGELAARHGLDYYVIQRRMSELEREGKVVRLPARTCAARKTKATVWDLPAADGQKRLF